MSNQSNPKGGHQPSRQDEAARKPGSRSTQDDTADDQDESSAGTRRQESNRDSEGSRSETRKPGGSRREG
jgi:hypothetical protein